MLKEIPGYDGKYLIAHNGAIYSKHRQGHMGGFIKPQIVNGYYRITLRKGAKRKSVYIHRLVADIFIDNPENKPCVNHKDGNKLNNDVRNLEWCTYSENMVHAIKTGLNHVPGLSGERHPMHKLSDEQVSEIRDLWNKGIIAPDLAMTYGVTKEQIYNIVHFRERKVP